MRTSENITNISAALLSAQKKIEAVKKGAVNPYFKSTYADLPSVMEACKKPLNDNGVVILQPIIGDFVETRLIHADSGEWMSSRTRIVCKTDNDPQAYGSAITYARRYGLQSMVFLSAEDDDGEGAMNRQTEARRSSPLKEKTATQVENLSKPANHPDNEFKNSTCPKCGAPIAISSKGNPYCTAKCWLKEGK